MKKLIFAVVIALFCAVPTFAQEVMVQYTVLNGVTMTTNTDSLNNQSLRYGNGATSYYGQVPDSVRIAWYGKGGTTGDSIGVYFKYQLFVNSAETGGKYSLTTLDSIMAQGHGTHTLDGVDGLNTVNLYAVSKADANSVGGSNPSLLYLYIQYFYKAVR